MDTKSEAMLLAHDALLLALLQTHPRPQDAFYQFNQIFPAKMRDLNKAGPNQAQLAADFKSECDRLCRIFPK